jgi:hypothetical protein
VGDIPRAELELVFQDFTKVFIILKSLFDFGKQAGVLATGILNPILDSPLEDFQDAGRVDLRKVNDGQVHPAPDPLLQLVEKGDVPGEDEEGYVLLDVSAVEPFEDVVEYPLLPMLTRQQLCVFYNQYELFSLEALKLLVQSC